MSAHTPGPWKWMWQEERTCYALKSERGQVLEIAKGLTPTIDDQRLIAAAPRMLDALREMQAALAKVQCFGNVLKALDSIDTVLRDVEGESNG